jgi:hypothetical protein
LTPLLFCFPAEALSRGEELFYFSSPRLCASARKNNISTNGAQHSSVSKNTDEEAQIAKPIVTWRATGAGLIQTIYQYPISHLKKKSILSKLTPIEAFNHMSQEQA